MPLTTISDGMSGADARTAINAAIAQVDANTTSIAGKLNLTGGTLTGTLTINISSGPYLDIKKSSVDVFRVSDSIYGTLVDSVAGAGGQFLMGPGGTYFGRRDATTPAVAGGYNAYIGEFNDAGVTIKGTGCFAFGEDNGNNLHVTRRAGFYYGGALNSIQMGKNHATTPTAQVFKGHNVTTGTGGSMEIAGGTGSVARGAVTLNGGNRSAYIASPSATEIRDILISHGLMAAS